MDMKPFFRAVGPAFHKDLVVGPFETVNIYPLMCHILGIQPEVNDGHLDATKHMLVSSPATARGESLQHLLLIYRDAQPSFHTFPRQTEAVVSGSVLVVRLELFYKKELKNTDVMTDTVTGDS